MKTQGKTYKGFQSNDVENILDTSKLLIVLNHFDFVFQDETLLQIRNSLAPWSPTENSIHLNDFGYLNVVDGSVLHNGKLVKAYGLFSLLFKTKLLFPNEIIACSRELNQFIALAYDVSLQDYPNIILCNPFTEEYDINTLISVEGGSDIIIFDNNSKVGIRDLNHESFYSADIVEGVPIEEIICYIAFACNYHYIVECVRKEL